MSPLLAHAGRASWDEWLYVGAPVAVVGLVGAALARARRADEGPAPGRRAGALERVLGFPRWCTAGVLTALAFLGMGLVGFYWDVAWHVDNGRDPHVLTPAHTMILLGHAGRLGAAVVAVVLATRDRAGTGLRVGRLTMPWSALVLAVVGVGGAAGFPLDELWHNAYGLDVTLWSPTHLFMLASASLATIALWLMIAEASPEAQPTGLGRAVHALVAGSTLVGLTGFQAEFDFGVPQFQELYLPLLVAAAAGLALVVARVALGPGGALKAVLAFVLLRAGVSLLLGGALNHTVPRFPLYVASALCVEGVAWRLGCEQRLRFALVSGLASGTLGLAGEVAWLWISNTEVPSVLWPKAAVLGVVAAVAAAVLGAGLSAAFAPGTGVRPAALLLAGAALGAAMAYPLPRDVGPVDTVIRLRPVSPASPGGPPAQLAHAEISLDPPDAARRATSFRLVSWQGGGRLSVDLEELGPGRYASSRPVPVARPWKTVLSLNRGDQVMAAPVYLPADPAIGASEVAALPERRQPFTRSSAVLLREAHDGPTWPAGVAYSGILSALALSLALLCQAVVQARSRAAPLRVQADGEDQAVRTPAVATPSGGAASPCPP